MELESLVDQSNSRSSSLEEAVKARASALRWLARREYAGQEMRARLLASGYSEYLVEQTLSELTDERYLSDERYIEMLLRTRVQSCFGPIRVYKDAAKFGLEDIMQRQVEESALDWREIASTAHNKRYRGDRPRDYNEWCKQARFLQSRGFNTDQVRFVLGDATRDL